MDSSKVQLKAFPVHTQLTEDTLQLNEKVGIIAKSDLIESKLTSFNSTMSLFTWMNKAI